MEVTLIQCATVAGHFRGVTAASAKPRPKKANKVEVAVEEQPKEETQANATTPKPKAKGQGRGSPPISPPKNELKPRKEAKVEAKGLTQKSVKRVLSHML